MLVDVVELERIPSTTSVMATYRVDVDRSRRAHELRAAPPVQPWIGGPVVSIEPSLRRSSAGIGSGSLGRQPDSLADVLERVLDKGIVIVGDVVVNVLDIELLTLKLRLFVSSAETAREMGLDWWSHDPFFSGRAPRPSRDGRRGRARCGTGSPS